MLAQLEMEKRNLESSLLFMQQEHSNTLKALHDEISKLQKKCTELTFQLTMHGLEDAASPDNKSKIEELQTRLAESDLKYKELQQEVESKNKIMDDLKYHLKTNERRYFDELKSKDQQVLTLKVELDTKSVTIATLTKELHGLKVRSSQENPMHNTKHPKTPPSREDSGKKRSTRKLSATATEIKSRPVTAKASMPAPGAEVFLARTKAVESSSDVNMRPVPPVLPPISASGDDKSFNRRQQLIRRRYDLKSQPEYTTLAVEPLPSNSNTYIHEPNTTK